MIRIVSELTLTNGRSVTNSLGAGATIYEHILLGSRPARFSLRSGAFVGASLLADDHDLLPDRLIESRALLAPLRSTAKRLLCMHHFS